MLSIYSRKGIVSEPASAKATAGRPPFFDRCLPAIRSLSEGLAADYHSDERRKASSNSPRVSTQDFPGKLRYATVQFPMTISTQEDTFVRLLFYTLP